MFPTFPSKAGQERHRKRTPDAPARDAGDGEVDFSAVFAGSEGQEKGAGFSLKMG